MYIYSGVSGFFRDLVGASVDTLSSVSVNFATQSEPGMDR